MTRDKDNAASAESWTVPDGREPPVPTASAPLFSPGDVLVERYELRRILGRGGMGVVFEAHDRMLDQVIALKVVRAEYAGERAWAERLAREVKLARQINHPNVCRVFDMGVAERHPFLTMELATRGTLRDEIASGELTARSLEERLSDVRAIASGLAAIHAAGIIHRDVAPQNVLRMTDGSLVLSDFGLATDRFDGNSSIQGGTLAYMAPEVVRGARASMASDVWALGVVIHEVVFNARPRWAANGKDLLPVDLGRTPLPPEKVALEACRACLGVSPMERPRYAADVAERLSSGMPIWRSAAARRSLAMAAAISLVLVLGLTFSARSRKHPALADEAGPGNTPILTLGRPAADWSSVAAVLARVPGKIDCMTLLPDRRTLRFVWGIDRRAADVDIGTGTMVDSPLVPAAYAEGCPHSTGRGDKMVFAGHDADDRPTAFVSSHADGSAASAVIQIAEPSMSSDPEWFPDGDSFLYALDLNHAAVYSMSSRTSTVVPVDMQGVEYANYAVAGDAILASGMNSAGLTVLHRFRYPHMQEDLRIPFRGFMLDGTTGDNRHYYFSLSDVASERMMATVDASSATLQAVGYVPNQRIRYPIWTPFGLAFVSATVRPVLAVPSPGSETRELDLDGTILMASRCGDGFIAMRDAQPGTEVVRLDVRGRVAQTLGLGKAARWPACSRAGDQLFYADYGASPEIMRCAAGACRPVYHGAVNGFALSPDDTRMVVIAVGDDGLAVKWLRADGQDGEHDVTKTAVACTPGWSSERAIWVSMRRGRQTEWREFNVESSTWTGRVSPGKWDCTDGEEDPADPMVGVPRVIRKRTSEVRLVPASHFAGR